MKIYDQKVYAIRKYAEIIPLDSCIALTLTMKQNLQGKRLDKISAPCQFRYFKNRLDKYYYKNAAARYNKRLGCFPVLEESITSRIHYHVILEKPGNVDHFNFEKIIVSCWKMVDYSYDQHKYVGSINSGWTDYCLKSSQAAENMDWQNVHIPHRWKLAE